MEIVGAAPPRYVLRRSMKNRERLDGAEGALAGRWFFKDFRAENIGGHEIGRELHAPRIEAQHMPHGLDEFGFCQSRHTDEQGMATGEHRNQRL